MLEINGRDAGTMTHKQAQEAIIACGDRVPLLVQRTQGAQPQLSGIKPPEPFKPQVMNSNGTPELVPQSQLILCGTNSCIVEVV